QDVAGLSRDVEHANQTLSPIFNKEKEQQRLQEAQKISEIALQAADIAATRAATWSMPIRRSPLFSIKKRSSSGCRKRRR
ncbi:hypothetical protein ACQKSM_15630, partial [Erwinia amylovora]